MTAAVPRQIRRRPAKTPEGRTVTFTVPEGDPFEGWEATARADFPVRLIEDLESGSPMRMIKAFQVIVTDHNLPDANGELAKTMDDVASYTGLLTVITGVFDAIAKLPNR